MTSSMSSAGRTAMAEELARYPNIARIVIKSGSSVMTVALEASRGGVSTAIKAVLVGGEMMVSSAGMLNIGEEDSPGNGKMVSPTRVCTEDVKLSMEEEDVRSGVPSFIPNANPVTTTLPAASADPESPTARVLE